MGKNQKIKKGFSIPVLDHGFVKYIDHLGDDSNVTETARVCTDVKSKGKEQDKNLLFYLYGDMHSSPSEFNSITFNIKAPIVFFWHLVRHRTFRFNIQSGRYSELPSEFYTPEWRKQDTENRQGSLVLSEKEQAELADVTEAYGEVSETLREFYVELLNRGIAKEQARLILGMSQYIEGRVNCDLNNLVKFFHLRLGKNENCKIIQSTRNKAQKETQVVAAAMKEIFARLFPVFNEAFERFIPITVDTRNIKKLKALRGQIDDQIILIEGSIKKVDKNK